MRLHGILECDFAEIECLVTLSLRVQYKSLHGLRVAMVGVLLENLVGSLDSYMI